MVLINKVIVSEITSHWILQFADFNIFFYLRTSVLLNVSNATDFQVSNFMFRLQYYVTIISLHKQYSNLIIATSLLNDLESVCQFTTACKFAYITSQDIIWMCENKPYSILCSTFYIFKCCLLYTYLWRYL